MLAAIKKFPILFVFALATTVFLAFLGDWQYQKGSQRAVEDRTRQLNLEKKVINLNDGYDQQTIEDGIKVVLQGQFIENTTIFHDNRLNSGKAGYHVFSIFKMSTGELILVNRGWVEMNFDRKILPNVITNNEEVEISGVVRYPVEGVYTLSAESMAKTFPMRLQTIEVNKLEKLLGLKLISFSVLLNPLQDGNHFSREWVNLLPGKYMSPDKHYAYSMQWYSLAIIGLIIFMILIIKMAKNEQD